MAQIVLNNRVSRSTGVKYTQRANEILNELMATPGLKPDYKRSIQTACNLFSDVPFDARGWPDGYAERTVISVMPVQEIVTRPVGIPTSASWDFHCAFMPFLQATSFCPLHQRQNNVGTVNSADTVRPFAGFTARSCATGLDAPWFISEAVPNTAVNDYTWIPDLSQLAGPIRVVGAAIEVRDVSKAIVKSGFCTAYRQPAVNTQNSYYAFDINLPGGISQRDYAFTGRAMHPPPATQSQAARYQDKVEWDAFEGIYQHVRFNSSNNPLTTGQYVAPVIGAYDNVAANSNEGFIFVPKPSEAVTSGTSQKLSTECQLFVPAHQSGFILTGLDPEAKLRVTIKYALEYEPDYTNAALASIAKISAEKSDKLLALIDLAMVHMPVAVPVSENEGGEWFLDLARKLLTKGGPLVGMIPHPAAQAISQGMTMAGQMMPKAQKAKTYQGEIGYINPPAKKKKKKTKKRNEQLNQGSRGKKGNIQGPMRM